MPPSRRIAPFYLPLPFTLKLLIQVGALAGLHDNNQVRGFRKAMPAQTKAPIRQALARLDAAGDGGSPAACDLQIALAHLGQSTGVEELAQLPDPLWPHPPEQCFGSGRACLAESRQFLAIERISTICHGSIAEAR